MDQADFFVTPGAECREFHGFLPCGLAKYMIIYNIDKQEKYPDEIRSKTKFLAAVAVAAVLAAGPVHARTKIQIGCTATTDCASAMIAVDEGIFKKHGLETEIVLIGINSNIPAAILSNSIQIGGPTPTVFLQAADDGLDLGPSAARRS
jgi:NitT/TauT family transport system substrate-binding protein